jgi:hypothetical protein
MQVNKEMFIGVLPKFSSNSKEWTMSEVISNGTFHDLFSSGYLKTVWSHVARVQLRALIASVLLVSYLGAAAQAQTATPELLRHTHNPSQKI